MKKIILISLGLTLNVLIAAAQQKVKDGTVTNGNLASKDAILELESSNKGLLHTRVALRLTTDAFPLSAHIAGMMVYNTSTQNDVVPGIYYNDGTKWVFVRGGGSGSILVQNQPGTNGTPGIPGQPGGPGAGVNIVTNDSGTYIFNPAANTWTNITGPAGATGAAGPAGKGVASTVTNPEGTITFTYTDGTTSTTSSLKGADGVMGPQGPIGLTGAAGAQGPKGDAGVPGSTIKADPANPGQAIITNPDGSTTTITLPVGAQGIAGKDGAPGSTIKADPANPGQAIITNPDGSTTIITLPAGAQGIAGPAGKDGAPGSTIKADPANPGQAIITNPDGSTTIITLPAGAQGIAGPAGKDGKDGSTIKADPTNPGQAIITNPDGSTTIITLPVGAQGIAGKDGAPGSTIKADPANPGQAIITNPDGSTTTITLPVGAQGPKGDAGAPGSTIKADPANPGQAIITNPDGSTTTITLPAGAQGIQGPAGKDGKDGSTIKADPANPGQAIITNPDGSTTSITLPVGPQGIAGTNGVGGVTSAGTNITITGDGSTVSPYVVNAISPTTTNTLTATNGSLVSTVNGAASTPAVAVLTTANNGLTATNGNVQLGGALTGATVVTASASNTLAIAGLQTSTDATKNIVVTDANGILKTIAASSLGNNWSLTGNAGTTANNFLGTTDNVPLQFKVGNAFAGMLTPNELGNTYFGLNTGLASGKAYLANPSYSDNVMNVAIGNSAFSSNTTGSGNVAIGFQALNANSSGLGNIAVGWQALQQNKSGDNNIAIGEVAGAGSTGTNNTFIGNGADVAAPGGAVLTNATAIGYGALVGASNSLVLGGTGVQMVNNIAVPLAVNVGIGNTIPTNTLHVTPQKGKDPVRFEGLLASTSSTDKMVVADATGVLRIVAQPAATEPWFKQNTTTQATANTDSVFTMGTVAIGQNTVAIGATLDVAGAIRGGKNTTGVVGANSAAFGTSNLASGIASMAFGDDNKATGMTAIALGSNSQATGLFSVAIGRFNIASGDDATAMGKSNQAIGRFATTFGNTNQAIGESSTVFGQENIVSGYGAATFGIWNKSASPFEVVAGTSNAITVSSVPSNSNDATGVVLGAPTDPIFQIGDGNGTINRQNAITILNNGNTGIGIVGTEDAAKPTERLDIGSGNVKIRAINTVTGAATDNIVVADVNGILKTIAPSTSKTSNTEPWFVQGAGSTTQATSNTQNIFTMGKVAIGQAVPFGSPTNEVLSVNGSIRTASNVYADYVFENYFDGLSKIKSDYKYKSLAEVAEFIRANKHLPGVTSIKELTKTAAGYSFNLTDLSVQSLEKLEELYLHVIEQQKQIEAKDKEVEALKADAKLMNERLEKLEKLLINK